MEGERHDGGGGTWERGGGGALRKAASRRRLRATLSRAGDSWWRSRFICRTLSIAFSR